MSNRIRWLGYGALIIAALYALAGTYIILRFF